MDLWGNGILQCNDLIRVGEHYDVVLEEPSGDYNIFTYFSLSLQIGANFVRSSFKRVFVCTVDFEVFADGCAVPNATVEISAAEIRQINVTNERGEASFFLRDVFEQLLHYCVRAEGYLIE